MITMAGIGKSLLLGDLRQNKKCLTILLDDSHIIPLMGENSYSVVESFPFIKNWPNEKDIDDLEKFTKNLKKFIIEQLEKEKFDYVILYSNTEKLFMKWVMKMALDLENNYHAYFVITYYERFIETELKL